MKAFLAMLLALLACASCVNDEWADDVPNTNPDDNDTPYYLSVQINFGSDAPSTRADGGTVPGDRDEHAIGPSGNRIIFFEGEGTDSKLFGVYPLFTYDEFLEQLTTEEKQELDNDISDNGDLKDNEEAKYTYLTRFFSTNDPAELPTSFLVLLNGNKAICEQLELYNQQALLSRKKPTNKNITVAGYNDIVSMVWQDDNTRNIGFSGQYFTMTNSMYIPIGDDNGKYGSGYVNAPVEVTDKFYRTIAVAKENPVRTYVERMVAKYTFNTTEKGIKFQPSETPDIVMFDMIDDNGAPQYIAKKWKLEVTGWNINAHERRNHYYKKITPDKSYFTGWGWNHPGDHRSYWSEDPDYDNNGYPWQYRQAIDDPDIKYYSKDENGQILKNYSFNDLGLADWVDANDGTITPQNGVVVYTSEHTYRAGEVGELDNREELLAGTHLLVGARLLIEDGGNRGKSNDAGGVDDDNPDGIDGEEDNYRSGDWYRSVEGLYYRSERECFAAMVHSFNQMLNSQSVMQFIPYDWDNGGRLNTAGIGTPEYGTLVANTSGQYRLYYDGLDKELEIPEDQRDNWLTADKILKMDDQTYKRIFGSLASAMLNNGDGKVLPWPVDKIDERKLSIVNVDTKRVVQIYDAVEDDYGTVLAGEISYGMADKNHIKSLLYAWLGAIDHFCDGKMYYASGIYSHNEGEEKLYGVVRNSWYDLNLKSISGMGVPVDDPDQPIIPDRVSLKDRINVTIKIIDWHEVETTVPIL